MTLTQRGEGVAAEVREMKKRCDGLLEVLGSLLALKDT